VYHLLLRYVLPSYKIIVLLIYYSLYQSTAKKKKNTNWMAFGCTNTCYKIKSN